MRPSRKHSDMATTMKPATAYLLLCVVGTILPVAALWPFLAEQGLNLPTLVSVAVGDPVTAFFSADVLVSAVALWTFVAVDGRRLRTRRLWLPVAATLAVGVSLGLPLFLYQRERALDARGAEAA